MEKYNPALPFLGNNNATVLESSQKGILQSSESCLEMATSENMKINPSTTFATYEPVKIIQILRSATPQKGEPVIVLMPPGCSLCVWGNFWLECIAGSVNVFGYTFQSGQKFPIFSSQSNTVFSIDFVSGKTIEESLGKLSYKTTREEDMKHYFKETDIAIVEISQYVSSLGEVLHWLQIRRINECNFSYLRILNDRKLWNRSWAIPLKLHDKKYRNGILYTNNTWSNYINKLEIDISQTKDIRIMVCGGQHVGKSTFARYLANRLLSLPDVSEVAFLDLDPRQPEFSIPGSLSLCKFSSPVLGPPYSHREAMNITFRKEIVLGSLSPDCVETYLSLVRSLVEDMKNFDVPIIVDTMGYAKDLGFDIMGHVVNLIKPSHTVTLQSKNDKYNFDVPVTPETMKSFVKKVESSQDYKEMSLKSHNMPSLNNTHQLSKKHYEFHRSATIIGYLSQLWKAKPKPNNTNFTKPVKFPWNKLAIHFHGSQVKPNLYLESVIQKFVALCAVKEEFLITNQRDYPKQLSHDTLWSSNICYGYGIVVDIDRFTKEILIITPTDDSILRNVNALIYTATVNVPEQLLKRLFTNPIAVPGIQLQQMHGKRKKFKANKGSYKRRHT